MRIFAQRPKASQNGTSAQATLLDRRGFEHSGGKTSIVRSQRVLRSHAVDGVLQGHAGQVNAKSVANGTTCLPHSFSRIPIHSKSPPRIQAKLRLNTPGDIYEQEADRIASEVMRAPESASLPGTQVPSGMHDPPVQRMFRPKSSGFAQIQRTQPAASAANIRPAIAARLEATRGSGEPLPKSVRLFMEPRFGVDFSTVRVHTGREAAWLNQQLDSLAFTRQKDIYFGAGNYTPESATGQRLLAHELAHVTHQENEPSTIRRKIKCDPQASLGPFLSTKGVSGFTESNSVYDHSRGGALSFEQEVLIDMLASPRVFHLDGDSDAAASSNLSAHVKARMGIVSFASKKQYNFAALSGWSMNPAFYEWDISKGTWKVKPGVDPKAAWEDVNLNPKLYAIGCAAATDITMKGGSGGANIIDIPSGDQADWVAGDSGYVENTKYPAKSGNIGLMGENIIYTGGGMFWGHFTGSVTYRTLADWVTMVNGWNGGAKVDTKRELPATGLLDK